MTALPGGVGGRDKDRALSLLLIILCHNNKYRPRPSGLGEIDGLHGTSTQSCILTYDLCSGEPLRRSKPAQDEWYVIMSGHPFIKALAAYWGGAFVQGLRCHFISMPGKSPMKLEVTSRHDHSCLLGRKASKQTNKTIINEKMSIQKITSFNFRPLFNNNGLLNHPNTKTIQE